MQQAIVDYDSAFPSALIAQGKGSNFLCLERLNEPYRRADGKRALYQLEYRWLSSECQTTGDQSWACVQGREFTYWQRAEICKLLAALRQNKVINMFDHFQLF